MKLHLPSSLRRALVACYSASVLCVPTLATGVIGGGAFAFVVSSQAAASTLNADDGKTYSGNIYNVDSSKNYNGATLYQYENVDGTMVESSTGTSQASTVSNHTLRFTGADDAAVTLTQDFNGGSQGGLITESNLDSAEYAIQTSWNRWLTFTAEAGTDVLFSLGTNTTIRSTTGNINNITFASNTIVDIAAGKTFNITHSNAAATIAINNGMTIKGGGTADFGIAKLTVAADKAVVVEGNTAFSTAGAFTLNAGASLSVAAGSSFSSASSATATTESLIAGSITSAGSLSLTGTTVLATTGSITSTGGSLTLDGDIVLAANSQLNVGASTTVNFGSDLVFDLTSLEASESAGVYTYTLGNSNLDLSSLSVDNITGLVTTGKNFSFNDDGTISYTLTGPSLVWETDDSTWGTGGTGVWETPDGGVITLGSDTAPGGTITIGSDFDANSLTVTGSNDWVMEGNSITSGKLTIDENFTGDITFSNTNTFSEVELKGDAASSVTIGADNALGTSDINYTSGTLAFAGDFTLDNDFVYANDKTLVIDTASHTATLTGDVGNIDVTGEGTLKVKTPSAGSSINVDTGTTVTLTGDNTMTTAQADALTLSGDGNVTLERTGGTLNVQSRGFTGDFTTADGNGNVVIQVVGSTEADRFDLNLDHTTGTNVYVERESGSAGVSTLYLSGLTGTGDVTARAGGGSSYSHTIFDLKMTEDNTFDGAFKSTGNCKAALTVDSETGKNTLTMSKGSQVASGNAGYQKLTIKNAAVELTEDAKWNNGEISFSHADAELIYAGNSQTQSSNFTSSAAGNGTVTVDMKDADQVLTVSAANTGYSGDLDVLKGTLKADNDNAFGTGTVIANGGTVDLNDKAISTDITYNSGTLSNYKEYTGEVSVKNDLTLTSDFTAKADIDAGKTLTLTGTYVAADAPTYTLSSLEGTGTLLFDLANIDALGKGDYIIAHADNLTSWASTSFDYDLANTASLSYGYSFSTDASGNLVLTLGDAGFYWRKGAGTDDGTWDINDGVNWSQNATGAAESKFSEGSVAIFRGDGTNDTTITVASGVAAGNGENQSVGVLRVENGTYTFDGSVVDLKGSLVVGNFDNKATEEAHAIFEKAPTIGGNTLIYGDDSTLTIKDGSLKTNQLVNEGTVTVEKGNVEIKTAVGDDGGTLHVDAGTLSMGAGNNVFDELKVRGAVTGNTGKLTVGGTSEVGSLAGNGALEVATASSMKVNSNLVLSALSGAGDLETTGDLSLKSSSSIGNLTVGSGNLTIVDDLALDGDLTLAGATGTQNVTITSVLSPAPAITATGDLIATGGVNFNLSSATLLSLGLDDATPSYTLASFGSFTHGDDVTLNGVKEYVTGQNRYTIEVNGNDIVITRTFVPSQSFYEDALSLTQNGTSGAGLLDGAVNSFAPQGNATLFPDLAGVVGQVDALIVSGNRAEADRLAAAVAGASVANLGGALLNDVERQLKMVRNRTMSMGVDPSFENDLPQVNGWIMAEGNSVKLSADGTYAGYTFNNWGGSFGVDVNVSDKLTLGAAVTAMYGKISGDGPDASDGTLDMCYMTGFARYMKGRWSHSFVATAGLADATLDRTVTHGGGSYTTKGDTDGYGLGFLYEVGYTIPMNEDASACWQPVVNVALIHSQINGYTETGSDAGLMVDDMTNTYAVIGAGARAEFVVGQSLYNRSSVLQLRAMAKADIGDRQVESDVKFQAGGKTVTVKGAEAGRVGGEVGAGLIVPVGAHSGDLFIDAAVEFRSGMGSYNGTVGYRFSF